MTEKFYYYYNVKLYSRNVTLYFCDVTLYWNDVELYYIVAEFNYSDVESYFCVVTLYWSVAEFNYCNVILHSSDVILKANNKVHRTGKSTFTVRSTLRKTKDYKRAFPCPLFALAKKRINFPHHSCILIAQILKALHITLVAVAQLPFLEILFPKHKILTSFNHF